MSAPNHGGWTESDKAVAARVARRNAEHERIMAEKAAEAAQLSNIQAEVNA